MSVQSPRFPRPTLLIAVTLAIVGSFVAGWVAGTLRSFTPAAGGLSIGSEITGVVTVVNYDGSKFCLAPDGGGEPQCSVAYRRPGAPPVRVGEHVRATTAQIHTGGGDSSDAFIVTSPEP